MVGLPWEQHVAFLDDRARAARRSRQRVRDGVRACAGHPAVLCYAIGNEIPAVDRPLARPPARRALPRAALPTRSRRRIPAALVTYVNYPSTEYLAAAVPRLRLLQRLPRVAASRFEAYLARLQNLAGDRPL